MNTLHQREESHDYANSPSHNFDSGGSSRAPSSARRALTISSKFSSNLALSFSHPLKSAASLDRTWRFFPLFHSPLNRKPSRLSGISASLFDPRSFISFRSFSKAVSISLSTHQLVSECFDAHSSTLSHNRIPRSTCS